MFINFCKKNYLWIKNESSLYTLHLHYSVPRPSYYTLVHFFIHNNLSRIAVSNFLKVPYTFFQFHFSVYAFLNVLKEHHYQRRNFLSAVTWGLPFLSHIRHYRFNRCCWFELKLHKILYSVKIGNIKNIIDSARNQYSDQLYHM